MSINNIENQVYQAIEMVVEHAISNAKFDKTIRATVVECVDQTIGKHKVKYQDGVFFAYTESPGAIKKNTEVYVLIHNNDFSANKTILGSVDKLGSDYVDNNISLETRYEKIGASLINIPNGEFGLCSYVESQDNSLYSDNEIAFLPAEEINEYISQGSSLILEAEFKTALDKVQRTKGNYGILLDIDFYKTEEKNEDDIVTKNFVFDINNIQGEPYALAAWTPQFIAFDIENEKFKAIKDIRIFEYGFPNQAEGKPSDIFVKNISLYAANIIPEEQLSGAYLSIITPQGTIFTAEATDDKSMRAEVRMKGEVVDADYKGLKYYWFRENAGVTVGHDKYHKYAGGGWECLNEKKIIPATEDAPETTEWIPGQYEYTIIKDSLLSLENRFKCVVSCDGTILSRIVTFKNKDAEYKIEIISSDGFDFYQNVGAPTLTCMVKDLNAPDGYIYQWCSIDNNNIIRRLEDTLNDKEIYGIDDVIKNQLIGVQISNISKFTTYKCAVYEKDGDSAGRYIGTAAATLTNQDKQQESEDINVYSLVLNNASQLFKYNEDGVAPNSSSLEEPITLVPLTFTLYNNKGEEIPSEDISKEAIQWTVPTEDTLLTDIVIGNNNTELSYNLASRYDINKTENTIYLQIQYDGVTTRAQSNFFFVREGDAGTSGTQYTCKIIPNQAEDYNVIYPQMFYNVATGVYSLNYNRPANEETKWFKVQVWRDNDQIIEDTFTSGIDLEGKEYSVKWSMLANKYSANEKDTSNIVINETTGECSIATDYSYSDNLALLVRCEVVITEAVNNKKLKLFGTLPLTVNNIFDPVYDSNRIILKEGTGFREVRYASDGSSPSYVKEPPFEVEIENGNVEDYDFTWTAIGTINGESSGDLETNDYINRDYADTPWIRAFRPTSKYTGECVTNGIICIVAEKTTNTTIGNIYIPIHMYLNTYGQAALNDWDGNTLQLNEDGGYILAPKIGAGEKNDSNQFTGMVMGQVRESGKTTVDNGLLGYVDGVRSFFLNAETGRAEFGKPGESQIIIDPEESFIKSGNYSTVDGTGLLIDLIKPEIRYGSGNFVVDKDGNLTATGADITGVIKADGGYIGGWYLSGGALVNDVEDTTITLSPQLGITVGDSFQVTPDGTIRLTGNIIWGDNDSGPVSQIYALYAEDELTTPNKKYSEYDEDSTTDWHTQLNASADFYVSYSYDNGNSWTAPLVLQGQDGATGPQGPSGSSASVTRNNIVKALKSYMTGDGVYSYLGDDGEYYLGIDATYINAGVIEGIDIYGGSFYSADGTISLTMSNYSALHHGFIIATDDGDQILEVDRASVGLTNFYMGNNAIWNVLESSKQIKVDSDMTWDFTDVTVEGLVARFIDE